MASKNKDERACVNALLNAIRRNSPTVYVHIDRDAGSARHTSSGWDFILVYEGKAIFCEAKTEKGVLSDWQKFTQALILSSKTPYRIVRFFTDGFFSVDDGKRVAIIEAKLQDF